MGELIKDHAKFLCKELLTTLKMLERKDYDEELDKWLTRIEQKIRER